MLQFPLYKGCVEYPTWTTQLIFVSFNSVKLQGKLWRPEYTTIIGWCVLVLRWRNAVHRWGRNKLLILCSCKRHYLVAFAQNRLFKLGCRAVLSLPPSSDCTIPACSPKPVLVWDVLLFLSVDPTSETQMGGQKGLPSPALSPFQLCLLITPFLQILLHHCISWWGCFGMFSNLCQSKSTRLPNILQGPAFPNLDESGEAVLLTAGRLEWDKRE